MRGVERVFAGLSAGGWRLPAKLVPVDPALPRWTVFELAGHFDIAIGLTRMLIARAVPAGTMGPGYFAPMRVDEFVASRIVEAAGHGIDLTPGAGL